MKHTKGKWIWRLNPDDKDFWKHDKWIDAEDGTPICEVRNYRQIQIDNSNLIASAPDLLEACKEALNMLDNITTEEFAQGKDKAIRDKLINVIARAEGKEGRE